MSLTLNDKQIGYIIAGVAVLAYGLGLLTGIFFVNNHPLKSNTTVDTLVVTKFDTIRISKPFEVIKEVPVSVEKVVKDTVYKNRPYIKDSIVYIPISRTWFRKGDVDVWATGYKVDIDSIHVLRPTITKVITNTVTKSYDNEISLGVDLSTMFAGTYKVPIVAAEFQWDKGRSHTFAKIGGCYIDGKMQFMFETGYVIKFYQRKY